MKKIESYDKVFNDEEKKEIVNDYTNGLLSLRELSKKYNIHSKIWLDKLLCGKKRTLSEANKIVRQRYPEKFKHSEETKRKIREIHLKWMKEHPEQTAWRQKNMSYPEKCFKKILEDNGLDKKYLIYREYSIFPYFIDFAFVNEKLAIEIDGSQHLEEERKKSDEKKDALLISKGWRVLRIAATEVTHDGTKALNGVLKMLSDNTTKSSIVGILKAPKTRSKVIRGKDGLTDKQREQAFKSRKVKNRPSKEELWELVKTESFSVIGKKYGVHGNTIKKWCKQYGLPHKKEKIDQLIGKEHKYAKTLRVCLYCGKEYYNCESKFCSKKCYNEYVKENGFLNKENRKRSFNWVYKLNEDGQFTNKRVSNDEIEKYTSNGWVIGRKIKKK